MDKTIRGLAYVAIGKEEYNYYNVSVIKHVGMPTFGMLWFACLYRAAWKKWGVIDNPFVDVNPLWSALLVISVMYSAVVSCSHPASDIAKLELEGYIRWFYVSIGLFIFPLGYLICIFSLF